jgi:predicted DNA-binding transcriptional regulator AlpA
VFAPDERAAVYLQIVAGVAEQLAADGRLRPALEAALERVAERQRSLELLDAREVGAWLGIAAKSVGGLVRSGRLAAPLMVGKHRRWRRSDVDAFVAGGDATGANGLLDRGAGQAGAR